MKIFYLKSLHISFLSLIYLANTNISLAQEHVAPTTKVNGYVGIIHPLINFNKNGAQTNFKDYYVVGMPMGINLWKTEKVGFSFEIVPFIRAENGVSKANNILIHPGLLYRLKHGYTLISRVAFETSGRYGFTPILNKVVKRNKNSNYFVAVPLPVRFGNNAPVSATVAFQFGIGF